MRVVTVILSALAAIALGFWAYASGSWVLGVSSALFVVVTILAASSGRHENETPPVAPKAPVAPAPAATVAETVAPAPETAVDVTDLDEEPEPVPEPIPEPESSEADDDAETLEPEQPIVEDEESSPAAAETGVDGDPQPGEPAESATEAPVQAPEEPQARVIPAVRTPFSVEPAVVLMSLYDAIAEVHDALAAHLWLLDGNTATLRLIAAFGPRVPSPEPLPLDDTVLGAAIRTGSAVFLPIDEQSGLDEPVRQWRYAVPVGTPEMRGVAAVDLRSAGETPSALVLNEVSAILRGSLTAALAIHVAHAEMETAVELLHAARELTCGVGQGELLASALDRAMRVAGASTGSVMMPDPATGVLRIVASKGLPDDVVRDTEMASGEGIAGQVFSSLSPLLVEDLPGRPGSGRHGVLSSVSVPIADEQGSLGVINVGTRTFPARLTEAYVRALKTLGSQTAVAMRSTESVERSWDMYLENLQALATALEANDPYRRDASRRTAVLCVALGEAIGLHADEIVSLRIAAILHDVGMGLATGSLGAADRPLSTVDRGLVRSHPKVGSDVMMSVPSLRRLAPVVRHHHEHFDGDGYDMGLAGDEIPLGSRILAVADAFVAMTSPRPYREALTVEVALDELTAVAGTQLDPEVVETFRALLAASPELAFQV